MIYVIKFDHEPAGEWRYYVSDENSEYRYGIRSSKSLAGARRFESHERDEAYATLDRVRNELQAGARIYIYYNKKQLFNDILRGV